MNDNLTPAQRYYQRHKEARRAYGREYYLKNRDKILARAEERRAERDEEEYIANYVAERNGGPYMESDPVIQLENRHNTIMLDIASEPESNLKVLGSPEWTAEHCRRMAETVERGPDGEIRLKEGVSLIVEDFPIVEKIAPVAKSPLDAYRGRGVHNKIPPRTKNVVSKGIRVSGPVVVSFS